MNKRINKYISLIFITLFVLTTITNNIWSQTDTDFWFVAPEVTYDHNPPGGQPVFFNITTGNLPSTVTISQPANPNFPDTTVNIPANTTQKVDLTHLLSEVENTYEELDGIRCKSDKGFHITSTSLITVYYESSNTNNPDIFALKGKNSLGTEFYTAFQNTMYNQTRSGWTTQAYSSFDIVATQDNTQVTIDSPNIPLFFYGTGTFTINLDKGEVFSGIPDMRTVPPNGWQPADIFGRAAEDHLSGVRVTTGGNKIAITLKDDSMKSLLGGCYDLAGDQTIPTNIIGTGYIAMKGQLDENASIIQERIYVVSTQDNDSIWINDVFVDTQDEGDTYMYELTNNYTHIRTKKPSYVLQNSGFGCEIGEAILPPIAKNGVEVCTGSTTVSFTRSTSQGFYLNLMVRDGAEDAFLLNGAPTALIQATDFNNVPGSDNWLAARLGPFNTAEFPVGVQSTISNTEDVFHLGIINGSQTGGTRFGYFSDFNELEVQAFNVVTGSKLYKGCFGDTVQIVSSGGTNYEWKPKTYMDDPYVSTPRVWPPATTQYTVNVSGACNMVDSASVTVSISYPVEAYFNISRTTGCAPLDVDISAEVEASQEVRWFLGNKNVFWNYPDTVSFDTTFSNTYQNNTDTIQQHELIMVVYNKDDCTDTLRRMLTVYPQINADFDVSDSVGCHPLVVDYINKSSGNIDSSGFNWEFGDNGSRNAVNPSHTFTNLSKDDTIYTTTLIATSPFFCKDTASKEITVHPYIEAGFSIDTTSGCANFDALLYNNSKQVDTFLIDFGDGNDSLLTSNWNKIIYNYQNKTPHPRDTSITMTVWNEEGCYDTLQRDLHIYSQVVANFTSSDSIGCDSFEVSFTNNSTGYNLIHSWDFGDGSTSNDTNAIHRYFNKTDTVQNYIVKLVVRSDQFCFDTAYDTITVYPFIEADFVIDTVIGCHPFKTSIHNRSVGVDSLSWNFGDGTYSDTTAKKFTHKFTNEGFVTDSTYQIKLWVINTGNCIDSLTREVTVYPNVIADFIEDSAQYISCHPAHFHFSDQSQGQALNLLWNFDDGATSVRTNPDHQYEPNMDDTARKYRVTLFVTDSVNNVCTDSKDTIVEVNPYIEARFSVEDYIDCAPFYNTFDNATIGGVDSCKWYIDSTLTQIYTDKTSFADSFQNTTDTILTYEVMLFARNDSGCSSYFKDTMAVYPEVIADFTVSDTFACNPLIDTITNNSQNAMSYYWDFGDQSSSTDNNKKIIHTFHNLSHTEDTTYTITLEANSDNCYDSDTFNVTVFATPIAKFDVDKTLDCPPLDLNITNRSEVTSASFMWDFGDNTDSTTYALGNLSHRYDSNTTDTIKFFKLQLTAQTDSGGCVDSTSTIIKLYPEVEASFNVDTTWGCGNEISASFKNTSNNADILLWDFGNGNSSMQDSTTQTFFNIENNDSVVFNVQLIARSIDQCRDTADTLITLYPEPLAEFIMSPVQQVFLDSANVLFKNKTYAQDVWDYEWDFGDNNSSTTNQLSFYHTYHIWGDKNNDYKIPVTMIAKYPPQPICRDTNIMPVIIDFPKPEVSITNQDSSGCQPLNLDFSIRYLNDYSDTIIDSIVWKFNDGTDPVITTQSTINHEFKEWGRYYVELFVFAEEGKEDYDRKEVVVYPKPVVEFNVSPSYVMLPNANIQTFNASRFADKYLWKFGDGNYSTEKEPGHTYSDSGSYVVTLIVTSDSNCIDSMKHSSIMVDDPGDIKFPTAFQPSTAGPSGGQFSPNDFSSTIFKPIWEGVQKDEYLLQIFNRWGELLFETNDIYTGWDGYYNDKLCKMDVYVWKAKGKYLNGKSFEKVGTVTLLR